MELAVAWGVALALQAPEPPPAATAPTATPDVAGLCASAREALATLVKQHPRVVVTSARRDSAAEAHAWAENIARRRGWMRILKAHTRPELVRAQQWIDSHWRHLGAGEQRVAAIQAELISSFAELDDATLATIAPHAAGRAFDLRKGAGLTRRGLRALAEVTQVLDEGDHWHVGFRCAP